MRRVAAHEPCALEQLISSHRLPISRLAFRLMGWQADVDDVVQDVFVTAFEKAGQYRGQASLWTWLTIITLNKSRTALRRRALRNRLESVIGLGHGQTESFVNTPEADELTMQVRSAVCALSPRDREIIILHHLEGKTPLEIGKLLALPANTIHARLYRARKRLKDRLSAYMKD